MLGDCLGFWFALFRAASITSWSVGDITFRLPLVMAAGVTVRGLLWYLRCMAIWLLLDVALVALQIPPNYVLVQL